jgi:cytoskeletal protein RodZ
MSTTFQALPDLATLRATKGISLEQIAGATRITRRYLEAIERGEFQKLPPGIYALSYCRQYARAVECDEGILAECCRRVLERTA